MAATEGRVPRQPQCGPLWTPGRRIGTAHRVPVRACRWTMDRYVYISSSWSASCNSQGPGNSLEHSQDVMAWSAIMMTRL